MPRTALAASAKSRSSSRSRTSGSTGGGSGVGLRWVWRRRVLHILHLAGTAVLAPNDAKRDRVGEASVGVIPLGDVAGTH